MRVTFLLTMGPNHDGVSAMTTFDADVAWTAFDVRHLDLVKEFRYGPLIELQMAAEDWCFVYRPPLRRLTLFERIRRWLGI